VSVKFLQISHQQLYKKKRMTQAEDEIFADLHLAGSLDLTMSGKRSKWSQNWRKWVGNYGNFFEKSWRDM